MFATVAISTTWKHNCGKHLENFTNANFQFKKTLIWISYPTTFHNYSFHPALQNVNSGTKKITKLLRVQAKRSTNNTARTAQASDISLTVREVRACPNTLIRRQISLPLIIRSAEQHWRQESVLDSLPWVTSLSKVWEINNAIFSSSVITHKVKCRRCSWHKKHKRAWAKHLVPGGKRWRAPAWLNATETRVCVWAQALRTSAVRSTDFAVPWSCAAFAFTVSATQPGLTVLRAEDTQIATVSLSIWANRGSSARTSLPWHISTQLKALTGTAAQMKQQKNLHPC